MTRVLASLLVLLLTTALMPGCTTPEEHAARNRAEQPGGITRTVIQVIGSNSEMSDRVVLVTLQRTQGVLEARYDATQDVFIVLHRRAQVERARLLTLIRQAGKDSGYSFDPKFY